MENDSVWSIEAEKEKWRQSDELASKIKFTENFNGHHAKTIDEIRGFTTNEYDTCLKVLKAFSDKMEMLEEYQYKELRTLGKYAELSIRI